MKVEGKMVDESFIKFKSILSNKDPKNGSKRKSKYFKIMCDNQFLVIFENIPVI